MKQYYPSLTISGSARVLGISRQAVSQAVYSGRLFATGEPRNWEVPVDAIVRFAAHRGQDLDIFVERLACEFEIDWLAAARLVLTALGLRTVANKLG